MVLGGGDPVLGLLVPLVHGGLVLGLVLVIIIRQPRILLITLMMVMLQTLPCDFV